jgi:hypothetical protein
MSERYLVLDSRIIERTNNAKLVVTTAVKKANNPLFGEDKPWEKRYDNLYANVMYDRQDERYKCWYSPFIIDYASKGMPFEERMRKEYVPPKGRIMGVCYATSRDGIVWDKPELGLVDYNGSRKNNIVYRGPHGAGIFKDLREKDAARRYKMLASSEQSEMAVSFSSDGIQWGPLSHCPKINPYRVDGTHYNTLWVDELGEYVGFTRMRNKREGGTKTMKQRIGAWPIRQVGRTTSVDYLNWTKATPIFEGLSDNLQIYSMPVFRHGSVFLGLPVIHNQAKDQAWTELAWSTDTIVWHRVCPGSALIPNSMPFGSYDWGCAYSSAYPVFLEDEIRLYYGASNGLHFGWRDGFLCLATLRPDGFAGFEQVSAKKAAVVTTVPLTKQGNTLHLSADVQDAGSVRVKLFDPSSEQLLAQSEPIRENVTDGCVKWLNGFSLNTVKGTAVRLQCIINAAKLYSLGFNLTH